MSKELPLIWSLTTSTPGRTAIGTCGANAEEALTPWAAWVVKLGEFAFVGRGAEHQCLAIDSLLYGVVH
ncbi:hypothetical protein Trco_007420 [Trichoderma cornu-damae]|uniref:Uncharacterized protein n=1 Tax=Trichoderma cornu-damae TaxID=654480 RepID=A0A9P8QG04_9HYPO|nr:hypothetical protein Trco_007420 [Trichoderma cornu-damae]